VSEYDVILKILLYFEPDSESFGQICSAIKLRLFGYEKSYLLNIYVKITWLSAIKKITAETSTSTCIKFVCATKLSGFYELLKDKWEVAIWVTFKQPPLGDVC